MGGNIQLRRTNFALSLEGLTDIDLNSPSDQDVLTYDQASTKWVSQALPASTNEKVKVDAAATAGYLGATAGAGVLRTGASLSYTDGGNFITLNTIQDIQTSASPTFAGLTITDYIYFDKDTEHVMTLKYLHFLSRWRRFN